jgi:diguanylate cyclase (GGDEF)-like protein
MFEQLPSVLTRKPGDVAGEAIFVVDTESGTLSYVNSVAAGWFESVARSLVGTRAVAVIPELADLSTRRFTTSARTRAGDPLVSVAVEALDTEAGRPAATLVRMFPLGTPPVHSAESRDAPRSGRLESLWTLVVRRGLASADQLRAILDVAASGIGLERSTLARIDRGDLAIEFSSRDERDASSDVCLARRAIAGSGTFAVLDTSLDLEFAEVASDTRSFLSAAFRAGEQRYVLTFASAEPRSEPFSGDDWDYVDHVVEAVSRAIERRENDERIERLAYFDALTTLPNRIALHARLDDAIREATRAEARTAVLFLDIDGFKSVNDSVGHRGGDVVLAEVAQRLRGTLRRDEYIGRLGGDEFAIVVPSVADRGEIESIAQRVGGVLTFPFSVEGYRFSLSASIGVAIYPDDATTRDDLLACADAAMYAAKDDGGSRLRFRDTRTALAGEARDLSYLLCYQPIVDAGTGRVEAAEALIRRIHPDLGLLAPERGWSIAHDESGRRALDRWVLGEAAAQARSWNLAGTPIRVDVNLAAYDTREIDAIFSVDAFAADACRIRIEMSTARFASADETERTRRFVDRCSEIGIGVALDDFNGALTDLPGLADLPIDAIKLERSLVETVSVSRTTRAIVEGSIGVARALGWHAIAKGVETSAQYDALVSAGCDGIQGYYVAHPMTAIDFGRWLRDREALAERA